ncbi:MAG: Chain length determinant protein, partial [Actinomycetota bacterium]
MVMTPQVLSMRDYWRIITGRKWIVISVIVLITAGAIGMSASQTPIYEAQARMAIRSTPGSTVFGSESQTISDRARTMLTEVEVLKSDV